MQGSNPDARDLMRSVTDPLLERNSLKDGILLCVIEDQISI